MYKLALPSMFLFGMLFHDVCPALCWLPFLVNHMWISLFSCWIFTTQRSTSSLCNMLLCENLISSTLCSVFCFSFPFHFLMIFAAKKWCDCFHEHIFSSCIFLNYSKEVLQLNILICTSVHDLAFFPTFIWERQSVMLLHCLMWLYLVTFFLDFCKLIIAIVKWMPFSNIVTLVFLYIFLQFQYIWFIVQTGSCAV